MHSLRQIQSKLESQFLFEQLLSSQSFFRPEPQDPQNTEYDDYNYGSYSDYGEEYYGGEEDNYYPGNYIGILYWL